MDSEWTPLGDVVDRSAGRRYYSSFRKGGSTFSVGQTVLLKADEATMKWCRNSKPPRCAWMLASGGTPATISDMWDGGSDDGAEEERSPACGRFTWYNFPDECSGARGFQNVFNEVYATEMTMEYELDTINGHVAVYKSPEACTAQTGVQCDERVATAPLAVVCRRFFSHDTGLCRPLYAHAVARVDAGAARSTTSPFRAECNAARCALQLDARPDRISGREAEQDVIRENISLAVSNGGGKSAIYISGLPGTGKTVTVQQAVRELLAASPKLFASVEINAFALAHPKDAYTELWSHIAVSGERLPREQALKKLKATLEWLPYMESIAKLQRMLERERGDDAECLAFFNSVSDALPDDVWVWPDGGFGAMSDGAACAKLRELVASVEAMQKRQPVVVMLDEVDSLVSQPNQGVLYNLFDWANTKNSQFILVAIANTMDLPERELIPKVRSRLGTGADARVVFKPYSREQIVAIVRERIATCGVFDDSAIGMIAAKVRHKGDIRHALQLSRRAIDVCERRLAEAARAERRARDSSSASAAAAAAKKKNKARVTIPDVNRAYTDLQSSLCDAAVRHASLFEKMLIVALIKTQRSERAHGGTLAMGEEDEEEEESDGSMEVAFLRVYDTFSHICRSSRSRGGWSRSDGAFDDVDDVDAMDGAGDAGDDEADSGADSGVPNSNPKTRCDRADSGAPWNSGVARVPLTLGACLPAPLPAVDAARRAADSVPTVYEMLDVARRLSAFGIFDIMPKVGHHFPCVALIPSVDVLTNALKEHWSDLLT